MQTRLLVLALAISTALLTACGDDTVATSDPGTPPSSSPPATPPVTPSQDAPSVEIGSAFRDFAQGGDVPPLADQVDLYLGNAFTGIVTEADDRAAWATCTEVGEYADRDCPLSPLDVLAGSPRVNYTGTADRTCLPRYGPIPPDLRELDRVVIVPVRGAVDSCLDEFAVQLFNNDEGELVAVSTLLGEP